MVMLGEAAAAGRGILLDERSARGRDGVTGARRTGDIGFASLRGGTAAGDHGVIFAGRTIDVPACFIAGKSDWGVYQTPGAVDKMQSAACTQFAGLHLVDGAGHWVQQEQPEAVCRLLIPFLRSS